LKPHISRNKESLSRNLPAYDIRQIFKWIVYSLLTINFIFYAREELLLAEHTLRDGASLLEWAAAFATTIDEIAWLALIVLFELETYALSDRAIEGIAGPLIRGGRIVCYLLLVHTVYVWNMDVVELHEVNRVEGLAELCQLADTEVSFTQNLSYARIDKDNCTHLSNGPEFFKIGGSSVVTDSAGLRVQRQLAWADLIEAVVWLLILLTIELTVRLRSQGVAAGRLIAGCNGVKLAFYAVLVRVAAYWGYRGHWLYVWDEFIWIAGFAAIEINISQWRAVMLEKEPDCAPRLDLS
jgi:hypothetical protein